MYIVMRNVFSKKQKQVEKLDGQHIYLKKKFYVEVVRK